MKKSTILLGLGALMLSLSSCLKDEPNVDLTDIKPFAEIVHSGLPYFGPATITDSEDTIGRTLMVNVTGQYAPTSDVSITIGVDNSIIAQYNAANTAIVYEAMPAGSFVFPTQTVTVKAGTRFVELPVTFYKNKLDPSKSYMLPIKISAATGAALSANYNIIYYHFIGNDFAGTYTYQYRRYQNGTGPGAGFIPSRNEGSAPDITNGTTATTTILPVGPTEFQMVTNYNGQGVNYDVTFTRTVGAGGVITYTNWSVKFLPADLAKWADAGITNMVAPKFTLTPPATNADPKFFELNYVSGGAAGRYIDDTYFK